LPLFFKISFLLVRLNMLLSSLNKFLKLETVGGIVLIIASVLAILLANTPLDVYYNHFLDIDFGFILAEGSFKRPILFWVNDALMAVFFFLVGLEIKKEILEGELSKTSQAILPICAAIGGIAVPALIFFAINFNIPENINGWAIPAATDIAFALAVLAFFKSAVPISLKIFLTAVAIIDDLVAIIIIALFYTGGIDYMALSVALVCVIGLILINHFRVTALTPYILLGLVLWVFVKLAGLHPTLAGVIVALCIPMYDTRTEKHSPVKHMEHSLHPWVAFMVLPIFGFANAGVSFEGVSWDSFMDPLTFGIIAGLFVGKQIGVFGISFVMIKLGLAKLPKKATWMQLYAVSLLCGIGFTMSLFIGTLAYPDIDHAAAIRLGVIAASVLSALTAIIILNLSFSINKKRSKK